MVLPVATSTPRSTFQSLQHHHTNTNHAQHQPSTILCTTTTTARERGRSGGMSGGLGGGGGSGDRELRVQRQRLLRARKALQQQLAQVQKTRSVQRAARTRAGVPVVALVGYTNTGKSSLLSMLSGSVIQAADRLFETLDPTLRRVRLPSGHAVVVADTVGFVSDLPLQLVEAFKVGMEPASDWLRRGGVLRVVPCGVCYCIPVVHPCDGAYCVMAWHV